MTKKFSQLADAGALTGAELIPVVQGGVTKKMPASAVTYNAEHKLRDLLEGQMICFWGHSMTFSDIMSMPGVRWTERLQKRLNLGWMLELGQNGSSVQDIANYIIGGGYGPREYKGYRALHLVETGAIELLYKEDGVTLRADNSGLGDRQKTSIRENLRAIAATFMTPPPGTREEIAAATGWTMSGQWTQATNAGSSFNNHYWSNTPGSYVEKVLAAGTYYVHLLSGRGDPALPFGGYQILVGGAVVHNVPADVSWDPPGGNANLQMGRLARKIVVPEGDAAARTVRIAVTGAAGQFQAVDCIGPEVASPPLTYFIREFWSGENGQTTQALADYQAIFAEVMAEFPLFDWLDISEGWSFAEHVGTDLVHPNDAGQWLFANNFVKALAAKLNGFQPRLHYGEGFGTNLLAGARIMYNKTGSFTFDLLDRDWTINTTAAGATTATIGNYPDWPIGTIFRLRQVGAGTVTIAPAANVSLRAPRGARTAGQYAMVEIEKIGASEWQILPSSEVMV